MAFRPPASIVLLPFFAQPHDHDFEHRLGDRLMAYNSVQYNEQILRLGENPRRLSHFKIINMKIFIH